MKKYLFGILAISLAVGFSAFTTKKASKPFFTSQDVYLQAGISQVNQRVEQGFDADDFIAEQEYTVTPTSFAASTWVTSIQGFTATTSSPSYMAKFTIDNYSATTDANDANGITIAQAIAAMAAVSGAGSCTPALVSGTQFFYPTSGSVTVDPNPSGDGGATVTLSNFVRANAAR